MMFFAGMGLGVCLVILTKGAGNLQAGFRSFTLQHRATMDDPAVYTVVMNAAGPPDVPPRLVTMTSTCFLCVFVVYVVVSSFIQLVFSFLLGAIPPSLSICLATFPSACLSLSLSRSQSLSLIFNSTFPR